MNLLREFQDVFARDYKDLKGLVQEMGEMKIDTKPDVRPVKKRPIDCMGRPGFTIINQQHPKLTGPFGNRPQSDLKSHPK